MRFFKALSFFFCCCLLFCCTTTAEKASLTDEQLAQIMADINVAEAATIGLTGYPKDSLMDVYYKQVFEIHGTSLEEYEKNLRIISTDMQHLKDIVTKSIELLEGDTKN